MKQTAYVPAFVHSGSCLGFGKRTTLAGWHALSAGHSGQTECCWFGIRQPLSSPDPRHTPTGKPVVRVAPVRLRERLTTAPPAKATRSDVARCGETVRQHVVMTTCCLTVA